MDTFTFTIALPRDADALPLLRELSNHVARFMKLSDSAARTASAELERAVQEHMQGESTTPVKVTFELEAGEDRVKVEVTGHPAEAGGQ